jgi:hypothetical protein
VIQDASGAVEILIPTGTTAPAVASRVEATGRMGTAYGSPRLRASAVHRLGAGTIPAPLVVRGAITDAHAWRLVTVQGRIEDTKKLGDRVRAELAVGAQRLVVVAQSGAGLTTSDLPEGATVVVTGIVRRAYPNATDRRASLLPRAAADVRQLTGASAPDGSGAATTVSGAGTTSADSTSPVAEGGQPSGPGGVEDADLADLASIVGRTVRVGGLVEDLRPGGFTLDDGTAVGVVILDGEAADLLPLIEPADAINVVGTVEDRDGEVVVVVTDPATVVLGGDLGQPAAPSESATPSALASDAEGIRAAGFGDPMAGLPGAGAGLASLLLVALASVVVTALRRRQARTRWQGRVADRLARMVGPKADPDDGPAASRSPEVA